jgi:hypothetical protein
MGGYFDAPAFELFLAIVLTFFVLISGWKSKAADGTESFNFVFGSTLGILHSHGELNGVTGVKTEESYFDFFIHQGKINESGLFFPYADLFCDPSSPFLRVRDTYL